MQGVIHYKGLSVMVSVVLVGLLLLGVACGPTSAPPESTVAPSAVAVKATEPASTQPAPTEPPTALPEPTQAATEEEQVFVWADSSTWADIDPRGSYSDEPRILSSVYENACGVQPFRTVRNGCPRAGKRAGSQRRCDGVDVPSSAGRALSRWHSPQRRGCQSFD